MNDEKNERNHEKLEQNGVVDVTVFSSNTDSKHIRIKDERGFTHIVNIEQGKGESIYIAQKK
ncbi:hypothetical protein HYK36_004312 [Salmonella enterica]|nr:hypothetical protein [Salmonella enterica]